MDLLFFVFIASILLIVISTEGREKKKIKEYRNEATYEENIFTECNLSKDKIDSKIGNGE